MATWQLLLCDIKTDTTILDLTPYCFSSTLKTRLNKPQMLEAELPIDQDPLRALQADGDPALWLGTRAIKCYRNGTLRGHLIVWTIEWQGDEAYSGRIQLTAMGPEVRMNSRWVYDGQPAVPENSPPNLLKPKFDNPIDSGTLLKTVLEQSKIQSDNTDMFLPIDTTGSITTAQNIWSLIPDTPVSIGDLFTQLVDSGVPDFFFDPVDSSMGFDTGIQCQLRARDSGSAPDKSGSIHFDYQTGLKNVAKARRVVDMSTLSNKTYYFVGPRDGKERYRYLITGASRPEFAPYRTAEFTSRHKYGTYEETRVYDDDDGTDSIELVRSLWKTEVTLRVNPRDLVYYTPAAEGDNFTQFAPFDDYMVGDIVAINSGTILGPAITRTKQRIYGFDITIDDQGVERPGELIASADAE